MKVKGFTLIEALMVIVLIGIIGAIVSPTLIQHSLFTEKYFADELLSFLRYARWIAKSSDCEVQVAYSNQSQIALFWQSECSTGAFDKKIPSPYLYSPNGPFTLTLPRQISFKTSLPLYFSPDGRVTDEAHLWHAQFDLSLRNHPLMIDGLSGYAYVKSR